MRASSDSCNNANKRVSVSNSLSGRHWELNQVPAVGDPTDIVQFGAGHHMAAGEGRRRVALQRRVAAYLVVVAWKSEVSVQDHGHSRTAQGREILAASCRSGDGDPTEAGSIAWVRCADRDEPAAVNDERRVLDDLAVADDHAGALEGRGGRYRRRLLGPSSGPVRGRPRSPVAAAGVAGGSSTLASISPA